MIAGIEGFVERQNGSELIVAVGPVALRVLVPVRTADSLAVGEQVKLYTHLAVREDHIALYGFDSASALAMFELLITVSGVGPKGALGLLSTLDVEDLRAAIIEGNSRILSRAPGVGARVASRIVGELQEKLVGFPVGTTDHVAPGPSAAAFEALIGLGYPPLEARRALDAAPSSPSAEELIRGALEFLDARVR
jgi:holliday junction DNA helicase RuvA